jgi:hypothetical protein
MYLALINRSLGLKTTLERGKEGVLSLPLLLRTGILLWGLLDQLKDDLWLLSKTSTAKNTPHPVQAVMRLK